MNPFAFGFSEPPVYVRAGLVIAGYPAHWWVHFVDADPPHGLFVPVVDYDPPGSTTDDA